MLIAARETYGKKDGPGPPFTNCYVNIFGPFVLKEGRKELKRCAELFPCLDSIDPILLENRKNLKCY